MEKEDSHCEGHQRDRQPRCVPEISLALFTAMPLSSSPLVRLSTSLSSVVCVQSGWPWLCSKPNARFLLVAVPTDPSSSPFTSLALFSSTRRDCGMSAGGPHRWSTGTLLFAHVGVAPAQPHKHKCVSHQLEKKDLFRVLKKRDRPVEHRR